MPTTVALGAKAWKKMELDFSRQHIPELIVLDLDATLWFPELFQLNQKRTPRARKDIHLFPDIHQILQMILALEEDDSNNKNITDPYDNIIRQSQPKWAVASRAQNKDWALELLADFRVTQNDKRDTRTLIPDIFDPRHIEIQGGSKKRHFQILRDKTNIPYHKMIFFDDWDVNLQEVSQLGVLSCHCPDGLTLDIFHSGLRRYHELKEGETDGDEASYNWMGYVI